ncbi:MAG: LLM class flavin-dependent oxidoreductase [Chromatiales bacterium]|nr:MAG: LLM class flavin-dependent oxidoreductase [Chromatiales bacterium]
MRIHFILEPAPADEFLALGRLAEELGFDAVWTANHASAPDPFLAFSLLARDSSRIRLGPVAVSPYELHPLKIANSLFTLNQFADGRANIVIGGGGGTMIAMHLKSGRYVMHERMVRGVRECVEFLKQASAERPLDFAGEVFQVDGYHPTWATAAPPRIYVGATKPQMLRMAAGVADGVMFSDLTEGRLHETFATLNAALTANERAPGFHINNLYAWHVKTDRDAAAAEARRKLWVRGMVERWYIEPFLDAADVAQVENNMGGIIRAYRTNSPDIDDLPPALVQKLVDELTFCGDDSDLDGLIERLHVFAAAGVTEMGLRLYDDPADSMRLIADAIGSELR